jgi:hypothetical protein
MNPDHGGGMEYVNKVETQVVSNKPVDLANSTREISLKSPSRTLSGLPVKCGDSGMRPGPQSGAPVRILLNTLDIRRSSKPVEGPSKGFT